MHLMFTNDAHRALLMDWEELAPLSLAMFRADSARYAGDPDFERLIAWLMNESPEFRAWWPRHDVIHQPSTIKRIQHPTAGTLVFEILSLDVSDRPGMRFVVWTPSQLADP
ncbi:MAG: transcriptional regulator, partial [Burkholderiales bacterium]|nr:transcriptional regulator [Burkholderiales bacterium]